MKFGTRTPRHTLLSMAAVLCAIAGGMERRIAAQPQLQAQDTGVIPIRVVNGHLIVLTDLVGLRYTNEASFEISLEYPDALTLHPDQHGWMGVDPNDLGLGEPKLIHIMISPGIKLSIPAKDVVVERSEERLEFQNMMTKLHSSAMGERKLKGTIGIGLLKKYHVTIDVAEKQMTLAPPRGAEDPTAAATPATAAPPTAADVVITPFEYTDNRIQIGVTYADDRRGRIAIGGTNYDTYIDSRVAKPIGKPAGDVGPAWISDSASPGKRLDLARYMAFRPKAFGLAATPGPESPMLITGVNFLETFRIELDFASQTIALTEKKTATYPAQDFAFFDAESRGTPEALEAYLAKYPKTRLSSEAADLLVKARLEGAGEKAGSTDADVLKAMQWAIGTAGTGRRTETCLAYLEMFAELPGRTDLAIAAGKEGLKYSREAFDARVVYDTHHRLGQLHMKQANWNDAWKHLLSAAFMAPDNLEIVLDLARVYDKQGQTRRAYARYKRVAAVPGLPPEISAEIKGAMDRIRLLLPKNDPLLADEKKPAGRGGGGGTR